MEIRHRSELVAFLRYSGFRFFNRSIYNIPNIIAQGDMHARLFNLKKGDISLQNKSKLLSVNSLILLIASHLPIT